MNDPVSFDQRLIHALVGRRLRPDRMPDLHQGQPQFRLWGADAGFHPDDIHADRFYRIHLEYGPDLVIRSAAVFVDGELISPCSGFRAESLDEFDYGPVLAWCLERTLPNSI